MHIVIDFRTGAIVFLLGGPDSGQEVGGGLTLNVRDEGPGCFSTVSYASISRCPEDPLKRQERMIGRQTRFCRQNKL